MTVDAIRTEIIARLEALVPPTLAADRFRAYADDVTSDDFRSWAYANPLAAFRRFDVETSGDTEPPDVTWVTAEKVTESLAIVVAYPNDNRAGGRADLLDLIDADLAAIDGTAGTRGFSVTPPAATISVDATIIADTFVREGDDGEPVWFGVIPLRVTYWRTAP